MEAWQKGEYGVPVPIKENTKTNVLMAARTVFLDFMPQVAEIIKSIAMDPEAPHSVRLKSAMFIYEQTCGKAFQSMEVKVSDSVHPSMMSSDQLRMYVSGKMQELILDLHKTGKLQEYLKSNQLSLEAPKS